MEFTSPTNTSRAAAAAADTHAPETNAPPGSAETASNAATDAHIDQEYAESSSGESDIDWRRDEPRKWGS